MKEIRITFWTNLCSCANANSSNEITVIMTEEQEKRLRSGLREFDEMEEHEVEIMDYLKEVLDEELYEDLSDAIEERIQRMFAEDAWYELGMEAFSDLDEESLSILEGLDEEELIERLMAEGDSSFIDCHVTDIVLD